MLEEALESSKGHWPLYIGDITAEFRSKNDNVRVLAHRQANATLLQELGATAWYSRNCWVDPRFQGGLGGLCHSIGYAHETRSWLCNAHDTDWVLALTIRLQHLLAFSFLCRRPCHQGKRRYLMLFVQGFGAYQGPGLPVSFPKTLSNRLALWCFRRLAAPVRSGRVVLAAETCSMQSELAAFSKLPVRLFPHPVCLPTKEFTSPTTAVATSAPITITCPGFARYEKGNDLLQEACRVLFTADPHLSIQVVSQWPQPFSLPDGSEIRPDPELVADSRFQLINHSLDRQAYAALLERSQLIVLPYRRSSYHNRVSRVAIEAAIHGIPLVYMSGTGCEEVVELTGAGVAIQSETPEALCMALRSALTQLQELTRAARSCAALVAEHYSAARFRQLLLEC